MTLAAVSGGASGGLGVVLLAVLGVSLLSGNKPQEGEGQVKTKVRAARKGVGLGSLGAAALLLMGMGHGSSSPTTPTTPHRPPAVTVPHKTTPHKSESGGKSCSFICVQPKN